jgi:hypothetical protein
VLLPTMTIVVASSAPILNIKFSKLEYFLTK